MYRRTLAAGAIVATSLAALTGLDATAASAASARTGVDSTACDDVFLWKAPAGDVVGNLCLTVNHEGTTINNAIITFTTTADCSGTVLLRVSGADETGREFADADRAGCGTGTATSSFKPVSSVLPDSYVCGMLLDDRFTSAEACVVIS
jgi:hypothetical protein